MIEIYFIYLPLTSSVDGKINFAFVLSQVNERKCFYNVIKQSCANLNNLI